MFFSAVITRHDTAKNIDSNLDRTMRPGIIAGHTKASDLLRFVQ